MKITPRDLEVARVILESGGDWTFAGVGKKLGISSSQVHRAWRFLCLARLGCPLTRRVIERNLAEFLAHGAKYMFPPK